MSAGAGPRPLPDQAELVVIGGGIIGCSVAYHLAKRGVSDVVLLEQASLTGGTTWHAAGLVAQLRATHNMTRLARYSAELYATLEAETGRATGYRAPGSVLVASDHDRMEELARGASMARTVGVEVEVITPERAVQLWPLLNTDDLVGGLWLPHDGLTSPVDTTMALAAGAKAGGTRVYERTRVKRVVAEGGRVAGVVTERGVIETERVVLCGGMWSRQLAATAGVPIPVQACEHFYLVTEPIAGLDPSLPILRDPGGYAYFKEETGKLLVGFFEPEGKPWMVDGVPNDFTFGRLAEDWDHIGPVFERAVHRVPALAEAGIQLLFNGPESFTPDGRYLLGEAPELAGLFVATGFNSIGIQSAGGVGWVLADWIVDGHPPMDLWDVDLRRMLPFQADPEYLRARATESLGLLYAMHWPFFQYESARGIRRSPLHDRLEKAGACFGEVAGYERPNWYAPPGVEPRYEYSYGRQNWFEHSAGEHRAVRERVGLFDQSSFAKFMVEGPAAAELLDRVSANEVAGPVGKVTYTQWLNARGGIEADLTVTRLDEQRFLVVTAVATQRRDHGWLTHHLRDRAAVSITDLTEQLAVIGVMGPLARRLLGALTAAPLDNQAFPFGTAGEVTVAGVPATALRVTYVGELGWELYVDREDATSLYEAMVEQGADLGLALAGFHAMNSLRMEAGYKHWGHDITDEDTPLEAGLGFAVAWDKPGGFIGREALAAQRQQPRGKRLVHLRLAETGPLLYHDEPILRDGEVVGRTTSGMFGHTVGAPLAMGYVHHSPGVSAEWLAAGDFGVEVAGSLVTATASLRPFYDPRPRIRM